MLLECADNFNVVVWLTLEMQLKQQAGLLLKWLQELGPVSHQELQFWVLQPSWSEQTNKQTRGKAVVIVVMYSCRQAVAELGFAPST